MDRSLVHRRDGIAGDVPFGELLGDVAAHAQGIVRTEVRLALAQFREEMRGGARRTALRAGAGGLVMTGMIFLLISGALALSTVMAAWMAVLITAGAAFFVAFLLLIGTRRASA